jgi:hypothetical protein
LEYVLHELHEVDGSFIADIGPVSVWLPNEIASKLNGLKGQRIGVLRTDCAYRFRIVGNPSGIKPKKADFFDRLTTGQVGVIKPSCEDDRTLGTTAGA